MDGIDQAVTYDLYFDGVQVKSPALVPGSVASLPDEKKTLRDACNWFSQGEQFPCLKVSRCTKGLGILQRPRQESPSWLHD